MPAETTLSCFCCMKEVPVDRMEFLGWCNLCVTHHPSTDEVLRWSRANKADAYTAYDLLKRTLQSVWN